MPSKEDAKREYEEFREQFSHDKTASESGDWFINLVKWMLENYSKNVDADYIKRTYPGAGSDNQAKKAISLAAKYASLVGGASGAAITGLELSIPASAGTSSLIAVPSIGAAVLADVAATTRIQLRTTYDLSVIYDAPLSVEDADDCYFIFMAAMGIKAYEAVGSVAKAVSPRIIAYNVRKLLRTGLRKGLVMAFSRVAGTKLAKKLTERAMMRLLVPGINIPLCAGGNYWFTRTMLSTARSHMRRRGAVVQPLIRLFFSDSSISPLLPLKAMIAVMESPQREGWDGMQLEALRYSQSYLALSDNEIGELDGWFERGVGHVLGELPELSANEGEALIDYLTTCAALGLKDHDQKYGESINQIAKRLDADFSQTSIATKRKKL